MIDGGNGGRHQSVVDRQSVTTIRSQWVGCGVGYYSVIEGWQ